MGINNPGGGSFTDILKWYDQTLAAPGRFDVSGIPQGYSRMIVLLSTRSTAAGTVDAVNFFLNGDTTAANYRTAAHIAGSLHQNSIADDAALLSCPAAGAIADYIASSTLEILFYNTTGYKINKLLQNLRRDDATTEFSIIGGYHWENTAAINRITIQPDGYATDNFVAGSRLQIWLYK